VSFGKRRGPISSTGIYYPEKAKRRILVGKGWRTRPGSNTTDSLWKKMRPILKRQAEILIARRKDLAGRRQRIAPRISKCRRGKEGANKKGGAAVRNERLWSVLVREKMGSLRTEHKDVITGDDPNIALFASMKNSIGAEEAKTVAERIVEKKKA